MLVFFVSDMHGRVDRYQRLFRCILKERPDVVLLGGDLLPMPFAAHGEEAYEDFVRDFLADGFARLRKDLGPDYPEVLLILGNDDPRFEEAGVMSVAETGVWKYVHNKRVEFGGFSFYGYAYVPPTPFLLKDWERYDVSRYVDPGSISPEEGRRSVPEEAHVVRNATILEDLKELAGTDDLERAAFLFHSPPHQTTLDRAALDGQMVDHVPLDVHIGSIAIRRFIETRRPLITLHGHAHESVRLTGKWHDRIGRTHLYGAAHDGPELALVRFDPSVPEKATRELL
ncbi:metallophosphoesterase [bacterium]|nr:metallophosphoesterase [bacterium]